MFIPKDWYKCAVEEPPRILFLIAVYIDQVNSAFILKSIATSCDGNIVAKSESKEPKIKAKLVR